MQSFIDISFPVITTLPWFFGGRLFNGYIEYFASRARQTGPDQTWTDQRFVKQK